MTEIADTSVLPGDHRHLDLHPMLSSDLERVLAVERAAYPIPWTRNNFSDCFNNRHECWVFFSNKHILGHAVVSYVLDEAHLLNVCIDPRYAGKGYGRFYLRRLIQNALARNCVMFFLEVRVSNEVAINLYRSEGFNEVGIRKAYYPGKDGREDAILMTLDLTCGIDTYA